VQVRPSAGHVHRVLPTTATDVAYV
jgi:hypothetical protein